MRNSTWVFLSMSQTCQPLPQMNCPFNRQKFCGVVLWASWPWYLWVTFMTHIGDTVTCSVPQRFCSKGSETSLSAAHRWWSHRSMWLSSSSVEMQALCLTLIGDSASSVCFQAWAHFDLEIHARGKEFGPLGSIWLGRWSVDKYNA